MLSTCRLSEFVSKMLKITTEELEEKQLWDIWLHRVFDKSYNGWVEQCKQVCSKPSKANFEATINESQQLLASFTPEQERKG